MKKKITILLFSILCLGATAQTKRVVDYASINGGKFSARSVSGLRSMKNGEHYTALSSDRMAIVEYRFADGAAVDTIFDARTVTPSAPIGSYTLSADENLILLPLSIKPIYRHSFMAEHWIYDRSKRTFKPLSFAGPQQAATISPDSRKAAFVRQNNLFIVDLLSGTEKAITSDGLRGSIIYGVCDWVYEEEYGFERAYQWSPSSDAIAFYRFDESKVSNYPMPVFKRALYPENLTFKYPKAGETNSSVQIRIYRLSSGAQTLVSVGGDELDQYIPLIEWTGRAGELAIHRLNRKQNVYDMLFVDAMSGVSRLVYSEVSDRYIDRIDKSKVMFLPESSTFIVKNENDGYMHLYLYDMNGRQLRQLTKGENEMVELNFVDTRNSLIYYTATDGPLNRALYSLRYGRGPKASPVRLSPDAKGTYSANFSATGKYYIEYFSSIDTPTKVGICNSKGDQLRMLQDNAALRDTMDLYDMPVKEFFSFTTAQGVCLNGYMLKPSTFDASKRYPVFMTQYSGPGSQSVANKWGVSWEAALVKDGYLVVCVDGRGTGFRGNEFRCCTYGNLGGLELQDQVSAAKYLASLNYVDADRIGIYGWSYGGFMALNAILKANDVFKMAVAVAPVTSWRYYDTIYTELYNGLPSENPGGYDKNSPLNYAAGLKGKLLLAHGTADDNVHIQNSYDMISALTAAGKNFEMLIYPDRNHGMGTDRNHLMRNIIRFVNQNL